MSLSLGGGGWADHKGREWLYTGSVHAGRSESRVHTQPGGQATRVSAWW